MCQVFFGASLVLESSCIDELVMTVVKRAGLKLLLCRSQPEQPSFLIIIKKPQDRNFPDLFSDDYMHRDVEPNKEHTVIPRHPLVITYTRYIGRQMHQALSKTWYAVHFLFDSPQAYGCKSLGSNLLHQPVLIICS